MIQVGDVECGVGRALRAGLMRIFEIEVEDARIRLATQPAAQREQVAVSRRRIRCVTFIEAEGVDFAAEIVGQGRVDMQAGEGDVVEGRVENDLIVERGCRVGWRATGGMYGKRSDDQVIRGRPHGFDAIERLNETAEVGSRAQTA